MTDWFDWIKCEHCGAELVMSDGYEGSKVMIIGAYPGDEEIKAGRPMVGPMGEVLRSELGHLGVFLDNIRYGNLWAHKPNGSSECFDFSATEIIKELEGKEAVLLLGKDPVEFFLNAKVMEVCGLFMASHLYSGLMMACVNPAIVFQDGSTVGELKLALKKFVNYCEKMELL